MLTTANKLAVIVLLVVILGTAFGARIASALHHIGAVLTQQLESK